MTHSPPSIDAWDGRAAGAPPESLALPESPAVPESLDQLERRFEQTFDRLETLQGLLSDQEAPSIASPDFALPPNFLLSIVVPIYNERKTLLKLLARVAAIPLRLQVILVDDCSTDGTGELLDRLSTAADVLVLRHPVNRGKGAALRTGFKAAAGNVVIIQDADLEYDPADIPRLLKPLVTGAADVVYGSRFLDKQQDPSRMHRLGNALLTRLSNCFTGLRLTDMETCYKAFRRDVLRHLDLRQNRFGFEPEITAKLARRGCRFAELPIRYHARGYQEGKKIGVRDGINALYCILRYGLAD